MDNAPETEFISAERSAWDRRALLVLGMHRSGTSALAGALVADGWEVPGNSLPPTDDNPEGYFESREVIQINNALLAEFGQNWSSTRPLPHDWAQAPRVNLLREQARVFLEGTLHSTKLVIKDPRLCRTFPFWQDVLRDLGFRIEAVIVIRDPHAVSASLARRMLDARFRPAGIPSISLGCRLWVRHVLDAERHTRSVTRRHVDWSTIRRNVHEAAAVASGASVFSSRAEGMPCNEPVEHVVQPGWWGELARISMLVKSAVRTGDAAELERVAQAFDIAEGALEPATDIPYAPGLEQPLRALSRATKQRAGVLFISTDAGSVGHIYRVANHAEALRSAGVDADIRGLEDWGSEDLSRFAVIVVFRPQWCDGLARLYAAARRCGARVVVDFDDLLFVPEVMHSPQFDMWTRLSDSDKEAWRAKVGNWRRALLEADGAVVSTTALASEVQALGCIAWVWANGVSWSHLSQLQSSGASRTQSERVRIGYASGTPTHQRDFREVAGALALVLERNAHATLTVVGSLDLTEFPELDGVADRIELRPRVPYAALPGELAQFDVNVAPLDVASRFCDAKSELKYFEAGLLNIPTVASPTPPFEAAIRHGVNGCLAASQDEWVTALESLVVSRSFRTKVGQEAFWSALVGHGPEEQMRTGIRFLAQAKSVPVRRD